MLLTFKSHKIAFTADIKKAFLQTELNTQDRDATRFLWLKDVDKSANNPDNLVVYRFLLSTFPSCPLSILTECHNTASPHQARRLDIKRLTTFDLQGRPYWNRHHT